MPRILTLLLSGLAACGKLEKAEACDLAVDWVERKGFPVGASSVDDWEFDRCNNFRSITEDGVSTALIEVVVSRVIDDRTRFGEYEEKTTHPAASCVLVKYDQGWTVEVCVPL